MNIIHNIKLTFNSVCLIYIGDKQELMEEDVEIIKTCWNNFTHDDVDPSFETLFTPEPNKITFTQEQKSIYCAEAKLSLKQNESPQEKKTYIRYQLVIYQ